MSDDAFFKGDERDVPRARRGKKRLRDRWLLLIVTSVLLVAILAVVAIGGYYGKSALDALSALNRESNMLPTASEDRPDPLPTKEGESNPPLNFVLMGTDSRTDDAEGRSDVLMLLHISGDREDAYLVSLPRDYWVDIPNHGTAKINAAYSWGGPALSVETVEQLLDVPIDHTALIGFEGFVEVIDALGGVSVVNRNASSSQGFTFPEGTVELTGESALIFVRERKNLPNGDFDRAERQRDVIKAIVDDLASADVLTNPTKFRDALATLAPSFTVDDTLDNATIIGMAMSMRITSGGDIKSMLAPTDGFGTSSDGQSYVRVDEAQLAELSAALRNDTMAEYYAANG